MLIHKDSELELGADTVCTRNENRLFHTCDIKSEASSEAADIIKTAIVTGTSDMLLHKFNSLITGSDINACRCVAFRSGFVMHYIIPFRSSNRYRAQIRRYRSPL